MTRTDRIDRVPDARASALGRVDAARAERARVHDRCALAQGTVAQLDADVSRRAADDEVAARERWLRWVEETDY